VFSRFAARSAKSGGERQELLATGPELLVVGESTLASILVEPRPFSSWSSSVVVVVVAAAARAAAVTTAAANARCHAAAAAEQARGR
jgi:hypothetical protein